jgi:saccharopine dehydrogenase-like NADP-dependent oxidoreductase
MKKRVLIIGGRGKIGKGVAVDLVRHTQAEIVLSGRTPETPTSLPENCQYLILNLADRTALRKAIASVDLVIHCAGPFRYRDGGVLETCIAEGVNYIDVSDDRAFTRNALLLKTEAQTAGITAVINTGVFPGISNSMARQCVEQLDTAHEIHFSYAVAGSGGAGMAVMRTTFLTLQHPFEAWLEGRWQQVKPYTDCEIVEFPEPFGKVKVCWFDMPEGFTSIASFSVKTITTKFGIFPNFYNYMTGIAARWLPATLIQQPQVIELLSQITYRLTGFSDRLSGTGVAVRVEVTGEKAGHPARYYSTLVHENAALATGCGAGAIAEAILFDRLTQPGVWTPEQILPTNLFEMAMQDREMELRVTGNSLES